jgi:hypothetical protein
MKPRIHITPLDFDSITNGRALCDAQGNIGPAEFCAVMMREMRSYIQSRLTEQGFSKHRTPEDTEFTNLAATKMILAEQFSLAQRIQALLERIDPATVSSFPAFTVSDNLLHLSSPRSAGGVRNFAEPVETERDATLQAVLRGQEEILRLVLKVESQEAKTSLVLRRMQDNINALHCVQTSNTTFDNAPSDTSAEDCPVSCSNCASTCIPSSVLAARSRNASPITMPTLPNSQDRLTYAPLPEQASASQSDQGRLQREELPAAKHFPDRNVVRRCVSMFSARSTEEKVDGEGLRGRNPTILGGAAGQVIPEPLFPLAIGTSPSGSDTSHHHFAANSDVP